MIYIYGDDYIKYLNDDSAGKLTYDQWKSKKSQQGDYKSISSGPYETAKYTHGLNSPGSKYKKFIG
jgi:hypothetical protein